MDTPEFDPHIFGFGDDPRLVIDISREDDTRRLGRLLAENVSAGAFVGLIGQLGAGKTTLVQSLVRALSSQARPTSPTYTLLNEYETRPPVVHVDLYRLESYDDLESIGYWEYAESPAAITCVEWLDRIPHAWPRRGLIVELDRQGDRRLARIWATPEYDAVIETICDGTPTH